MTYKIVAYTTLALLLYTALTASTIALFAFLLALWIQVNVAHNNKL